MSKKKGDGNSSLMFVLWILIDLTNFWAPYPPIFVIPVTSILLFIFHVHLYYQAYFVIYMPSSWTSLVAQMIKCLPTMQETRVRSLVWEDPLEKEMATHSSILTWRIPWMGEPGELQQSMVSQRFGHNWVTFSSLQVVNILNIYSTLYHFKPFSHHIQSFPLIHHHINSSPNHIF